MGIHIQRHMLQRPLLKAVMAATFVLTCGMHSEPVQAGWPVMDYTAIFNALQNYGEQLKRWEETARHYTSQAEHWKTQLNNLRHLNFALFSVRHDFTMVDPNFGVDVECPGSVVSGGLAGVFDRALDDLMPDMNGEVLKQQQNICVLIVQAKNVKYNDTVRYLQDIRTKSKELADTQTLIPGIGNSPANAGGYAAQLTEFSSTLDQLRTEWKSNLEQSDAHIDMLLTMQANLSRRAMNGSPSAFGTVVNAAALKAAFRE